MAWYPDGLGQIDSEWLQCGKYSSFEANNPRWMAMRRHDRHQDMVDLFSKTLAASEVAQIVRQGFQQVTGLHSRLQTLMRAVRAVCPASLGWEAALLIVESSAWLVRILEIDHYIAGCIHCVNLCSRRIGRAFRASIADGGSKAARCYVAHIDWS